MKKSIPKKVIAETNKGKIDIPRLQKRKNPKAKKIVVKPTSLLESPKIVKSVKTLHNTTSSQAKDNVKDIIFWGDPDTFKLICKASSKSEGWLKSTKAMYVNNVGCLVQVTTQQDNNVAESLAFVPNVKIQEVKNKKDKVISRRLVSMGYPNEIKG
jgi:hypothetical protein